VIKTAKGIFPDPLGMTSHTRLTQRALMRFIVILLVAAPAILGYIFVGGGFVAVTALSLSMLAFERETRFAVIKALFTISHFAGHLFPAAFGMTGVAITTQHRFVLVILLVTRPAIGGQFNFVNRAGVTFITTRGAMLTFKQVLGIGVVVESNRLPRLDSVARLALVPKMTLVTALLIVILAVTPHASTRRVLVACILVAGGALHIGMLTQQGKLGFSVIEISVFPTFFVMTIRTFGA